MNHLAESYLKYFVSNKSLIDELEKIYLQDKRVFKYEIKNKQIKFYYNGNLDSFYIDRGNAMKYLFELTIKKYNINDHIVLYLYIGDELPLKYKQYPILTFAKPKKDNGILIPDWTFINPYTSKLGKSWDDLQKEVKCPSKISYDNVFYFRGRNTSSKTKHNIRKKLHDVSVKEPKFKIILDPTNEQTILDWCKYKYLLDLPGSSPWSVRFKELFLLKSVVVKINTVSIDDINNVYINFYTPMFTENVDYISINYIYDQENGFQKCIDKLNNIHKNFKQIEYKKMMKNGHNKIKQLNLDTILDYVSIILKKYNDCLQQKNIIQKISKSILDKDRPCSSKTRKKNRYTRAELIELMLKYKIPFKHKDTIDNLCQKCNLFNKKIYSPTEVFNDFKNTFHTELLGWLTNTNNFRMILKGGQNFNILVKEKYNIDSPLKTMDYDFSISVKDPLNTFNYFHDKLKIFVEKYKDDLTMKINDFGSKGKKVPYLNVTKYYTIFIFFRGGDFIDLSFNNERIYRKDVEKDISNKIGLPIQTLKATFKELSNLIYRQSVLTNSFSYRKRNAFIGTSRQKGIKDLNRFQLLCTIHHFKPQCDVLKQLDYHFPIIQKYLDEKDFEFFKKNIQTYLKK